jgi:hypothetical protein
MGHILRHYVESHHTMVKFVLEGHKPQGRPRNSYILQQEKDAAINTSD